MDTRTEEGRVPESATDRLTVDELLDRIGDGVAELMTLAGARMRTDPALGQSIAVIAAYFEELGLDIAEGVVT